MLKALHYILSRLPIRVISYARLDTTQPYSQISAAKLGRNLFETIVRSISQKIPGDFPISIYFSKRGTRRDNLAHESGRMLRRKQIFKMYVQLCCGMKQAAVNDMLPVLLYMNMCLNI